MKTISLFLLMLIPLACSTDPIDEEEPELRKPTTSVFLSDKCPQEGFEQYYVNADEFQKINERIQSENVYCIFMTVTTYKNIKVSGYYAGQNK